MAILTMPASPGFKGVRFGLIANSRTHKSPITRSAQTLELAGATWMGTYELPPIRGDSVNAALWSTFFAELLGEAGRFYGFDPKRKTPRGSNLGTPLVKGGSQVGKFITTDGWDVNETGLLLPGDYIEIFAEYKKVTASVDSDGSGNATINFVPPIRNSPADDSAVVTTDKKSIMKLPNDDAGMWEEDIIMHGFSFSAEEVFP